MMKVVGGTGWEPSAAVRAALSPMLEHPDTTAIVTDFDGTISPIVEEPGLARPLDGAAEVVAALTRRFGVVAVVSGRPVSFLEERLLTGPEELGRKGAGTRFVGLYGLEWSQGDGTVAVEPGAEQWRAVVDGVVVRLRSSAPPGVLVEPKGLAVTIHWRQAPDAAAWAAAALAGEVERTGLRAHPGRMSTELRPPMEVDKGSVVVRLIRGCTAACYLGDDLGDLPAFAALAAKATEDGLVTASVAVVDNESAAAVAEAADVVVSGPKEALSVLRWLAHTTG